MALNPATPIDLCPFLPRDWIEQVETFASTKMFRVKQGKGGHGSISASPEDGAIDYETALRPELVEAMPWLDTLHREVIPVLTGLLGYGGKVGDPRNDAASQPLIPVQRSHGICANVFRPGEKGIEWHRDGADVYLNVILTTRFWDRGRGGRLVLHDGSGLQHLRMEPGVGWAVLTGDYPHTVEPPDRGQRVSVIFVYTNAERQEWREEAYNDHFYGGRPD